MLRYDNVQCRVFISLLFFNFTILFGAATTPSNPEPSPDPITPGGSSDGTHAGSEIFGDPVIPELSDVAIDRIADELAEDMGYNQLSEIICEEVSLENSPWMPTGYDHYRYLSLYQLCSGTKRAAYPGLACECLAAGQSDRVVCPYQNSDSFLWSTLVPAACMEHCKCRAPTTSRPPRRRTRTSTGSSLRRLSGGSEILDLSNDGVVRRFTNGRPPVIVVRPTFGSVSSREREPELCGSYCTSHEACSGSCACKAVGEKVDVDRGMRRFLGQCQRAAASFADNSLLGRRGLAQPCACNETFVSEGCCEAGASGIVWEGKSLGIMLSDGEQGRLF